MYAAVVYIYIHVYVHECICLYVFTCIQGYGIMDHFLFQAQVGSKSWSELKGMVECNLYHSH